MESKITSEQNREIEKFWANWNKKVQIGEGLVQDEIAQQQVIEKLGLHKRSITPTTLEKVIFAKEESPFYKEIYQYKDNSVTRFAFNEKLLPYEKFADSKKLSSWKSSTKSAQAIKANADRIELEELETQLLKQATDYLLSSKEETIVVDIFAREQGQIKNADGFVELHSVVLFKHNEKIHVIDPSNFSFSCHLFNFNKDLIITRYSTDKIYEPASAKNGIGKKLINKYNSITGASLDQYRDCIDIAVKIALGINAKDNIDFANIIKLDVVKEITNNPELNANIIDLDAPVRIKQATDSFVRKNFELLVDKTQKLFKHFITINDEEKSGAYRLYEEKYKKLLEKEVEFSDYQISVLDLKDFHDEFYGNIKSLMGEQHEGINMVNE